MNPRLLAAMILVAGLSSPSLADEIPPPARTTPPVVSFVDTAKPVCWARTYDEAHLKKNPVQKVTDIAFAYVPEKVFPGETAPQVLWDQYSDDPAFSALMVVRLKEDRRVLLGGAYCRSGGPKELKCGIEGDGGSFTLIQQVDGGVKLDNPEGFSVEYPSTNPDEPNDGYVLIDPKDDHRAFLMKPATGGLCDEEWAPPTP